MCSNALRAVDCGSTCGWWLAELVEAFRRDSAEGMSADAVPPYRRTADQSRTRGEDRRVGRPTLDSARRACARALAAEGFSRGKRALVRDLGDGLLTQVTVEGGSTGWARGVSVGVSVHREADRLEAAARCGEPARAPGDDDTYLPFALSSDVGRLLPRPHHHAWVVDEAADLDRLQEQLRAFWLESVSPHVVRWAGLLRIARTSDFLPGGRRGVGNLCDPGLMSLSPAYVDRYFPGAGPELLRLDEPRWLEKDEVCPWAPCAEQGRSVGAGGTWPDDLSR